MRYKNHFVLWLAAARMKQLYMPDCDVEQLAFRLLEQAKEALKRDKLLIPVAFVLAGQETLICVLDLSTEEKKRESYQAVNRLVRTKRAFGVITINDARLGRISDPLQWGERNTGERSDQGATECIFMMVRAQGVKPWALCVEYSRSIEGESEEIVFGEKRVFEEPRSRILPDWQEGFGRTE